MEQLPPQAQEQIAQMQQAQQQVQALAKQKQQLEMNLKETEKALDEISEMSEETPMYKSIGGIMARTKKSDAKEELEDKRETLNLRIKQVERQEERVSKRLEELRAKVQDLLRGPSSAGEAG